METIIMTDTASDMKPSDGVELINLPVRFGMEDFDGTIDQFYEKLEEGSDLPQTSTAAPAVFEEAFEAANGKDLVYVALSSKLSSTYQSAVLGKGDMENIYLVDSENAALGQQVLVKRAMELAKEGKTGAEIKAILDEEKKDVRLVALLDTLEYLKKGGRISPAVAAAGSLMKIKPVIGIQDGEVVVLGKARGLKKGGTLLSEIVQKDGADHTKPYVTGYTGKDEANLDTYIEAHRPLWEVDGKTPEVCQVGPVIGTHAGPGAIAVAYFAKHKD